MIAQITGTIVRQGAGTLTIDVNGVGYIVHLAPDTASSLAAQKGEKITVLTHLVVREDSLTLYGFATQEEADFFAMLITVSGIGPKTALAILSLNSVTALKAAIRSGDTSYLTKVSGIGKKGAQKIVLELGDKLGGASKEDGVGLAGDVDTLDALQSLGYSAREAREALRNVSSKITGMQERLREALKQLGK